MKAIILAAGRGSRMAGLTDDRPKCFLPLLGRRLIDWQIEALTKSNIKDIAIVTGYKNEVFNEFNLPTFHNHRWSKTNMVSSLMCAEDWLSKDDCIICYADIVYNPEIITKLITDSRDLLVSCDLLWEKLWSLRFNNPLDDAESFKVDGDRITEIGKKVSSIDQIEAQYQGILRFTPESWNKVRKILDNLGQSHTDKLDMTTLLSTLIDRDIRLTAITCLGKWCEADDENDLLKYEEQLQNNPNWEHDFRW